MAVASNLFPVTGQPLPFLSMGGTSIWFSSIAVGIILSVSRLDEKEENVNDVINNENLVEIVEPPFQV
jgi:cell division protein FtsW